MDYVFNSLMYLLHESITDQLRVSDKKQEN